MPKQKTLKPIERGTLWDNAYLQLREALFAGKFEPGEKLVLRDLAQLFNTSITPVRDAVTQLVGNGTLVRDSRNTASVPRLTTEDLRALTIIRCAIEGRATREAAVLMDSADIVALEQQLARMRELIARNELRTYLEQHRQFHFNIYARANIPILNRMIEDLWLRCGPTLSFVIPDYVRSLKGTDHHTAALKCFQKGDALGAEQEIVADIENAAEYLFRLADNDGYIQRPTVANLP